MKRFVEKYGTFLAAVLLFAALSLSADNFASTANILNILKQVSFLTFLAIGFTFVLITAELDLSFANVCSFVAVIVGSLISAEVPWVIAVASGLVAGVTCGLLNGALVTLLKIPSLIATLGTASVANGLAFMITDGVAFVGRWDPNFLFLGRGKLGPIPIIVLFTMLVVFLALIFLTQSIAGLHMQATGENEEAASRAGVNTRKAKFLALTISGLLAGITSVFLVANLSSAAPQMAGDYLLHAIAATLLGMTMFTPGKPNIFGTLIGVLIIVGLSNGLVLLGMQYYFQDIVLGAIIIASVTISASVLKRAVFSL